MRVASELQVAVHARLAVRAKQAFVSGQHVDRRVSTAAGSAMHRAAF